jgi:hypothetical protein
MAHLWLWKSEQWTIVPLTKDALQLPAHPAPAARPATDAPTPTARVVIRRHRAEGVSEAWLVLAPAPSAVRVNGAALSQGLHLLQDKDELQLAGTPPLYFSTERVAAVEAFPGAERAMLCPRCKMEMQAGQAAVRCPVCRTWYHQVEPDLNCYTYALRCQVCAKETKLGGSLEWVPEDP